MWRNWNTCALLVGMWNGAATMENSMAVPQKIWNRIILHDPTISLLGAYVKELKAGSLRDIWTPIFMAILFIITKKLKQHMCPLTDEWINKMWYIHTMEYYSVLKRKESLIHASTWVDLENIILGEITQSQKGQILYDSTYTRYLE